MGKSTKHPLRRLIVIAVVAGIVIAVKNSLSDEGGSYTPPTAPADADEPSAPGATAEPTLDPELTRPAPSNSALDSPDIPHAKDYLHSEDAAIARDLDEEFGRTPSDSGESGDRETTRIDPFGIR